MFTMWVRSVSTVTLSFSAISLLSSPSARAWSTSFSRGVSLSTARRTASSSWRSRPTRRSISTTSPGESSATPAFSLRTASTMSLIGVDLCSTPPAPASTARANRRDSMLALRTSVAVRGWEEKPSMRSRPSPSGRARSTIATSTSSRFSPGRALASASDPTCPTTSNPGSISSMKAKAWRNEAWSSTSRILIGSSLAWSSMAVGLLSCICDKRLCRGHSFVAKTRVVPVRAGPPDHPPRPGVRRGSRSARASRYPAHSQPPVLAELASQVPHGLLAHSDPGFTGVEAASVVGDLHSGEVVVELQPHPDALGLRMTSGVGESLLDDARDLPADPRGEDPWKGIVHDEIQLVPLASQPAVQVQKDLQGGDERPVQLLIQAQLEDRTAQPLQGAPEGLGGLLECRGPAVLGGDLGHLDLLQRVDDVLECVVVASAGYPVALGLPRLVQRLLGPLVLRDVAGYGGGAHVVLGVLDQQRVQRRARPPHGTSAFLEGGEAPWRCSPSVKKKVAPSPTSLSAHTLPPWRCTILATVASPMPVPSNSSGLCKR